MRVAVLSLTRDRLAYTKHCFNTLLSNAGCEYDHFVLDQGSTDGTAEWLADQEGQYFTPTLLAENVGICRGLNLLLDELINPADYDVIVKVDNDCEVLTPNTLRDVCTVALEWDCILSPHIRGLRNTPPTVQKAEADDWSISVTPVIGGIFMAVPAHVFEDGYRHNETNPPWCGDDVDLSNWWRSQGNVVGYLDGYEANHHLTTDGQVADIPEYFQRRVLEGGPAK